MPALVYSQDFEKLDFGPEHPLQPTRFVRERIYFKQVWPDLVVLEPMDFPEDVLKEVHEEEYIRLVKLMDCRGCGYLDDGDTPAFRGLWDYAFSSVRATLTACEVVREHKVVFNPCGGWHHARRRGRYPEHLLHCSTSLGFCVFNDVALALVWLEKKGLRPAYVDTDAHAGDGTIDILYEKPVLKISIHQSPETLYPGCCSIEDWGSGEGEGYTINVPMPPFSGDRELIEAFKEVVIPALKWYKPDVIVWQCGVDGHKLDPLTALQYTAWGYRRIAEMLRELNVPIVMTGGGGYHEFVHIMHAVMFGVLIDDVERAWQDAAKIDPRPTEAPAEAHEEFEENLRRLKERHPLLSRIV